MSSGVLSPRPDRIKTESESPEVEEELAPSTPTSSARRNLRKVQSILGMEGSSPDNAATDGPPETPNSNTPKRKGTLTNMLSKVTERRRTGSLSAMEKETKVGEDEVQLLRQRISDLELQVVDLEIKSEERERVVEHYRAKWVAAKRKNVEVREQAKGMFKALLDGDNRKLDELIRNHYSMVVDPASTSSSSAAAAANAFSNQDPMFTSHERMPSAVRSRQNSDPLGQVSSVKEENAVTDAKPLHKSSADGLDVSAEKRKLSGSAYLAPPTIVFKPGTQEIVRGSANDLVFFLVNVNRDRDFLSRFLLLFRQFMTPSDLLEILRVLMDNAPSSEKQAAVGEDANVYIQPLPGSSSVRQRVGYIMNRWLQDYFEEDFETNAPLRKSFAKLASEIDPAVVVLLEMHVVKAKDQRRNSLVKQGQSMPALDSSRKNSTSSLTPSVNVMALHPVEVARQLTLVDFELLEKVEPLDFLRASKDANKATTVRGLTARFNRTSLWIATEVLQSNSAKERAQRIKFFVSLGSAALEIKNFNLLMSVLAGLNFSSVQRLKKTWKLVSAKTLQTFESLEAVMSSAKNYQSYRSALAAANWPKLPYFGVFLRDLQFVDEGNQTWIRDGEEKLVNFEKVAMMEALLNELETYKTYNEFAWTQVPVLQSFLRVLPALDDESLHRISVTLEPISTSGPNYLEEESKIAEKNLSPGRQEK